MVKVIISEVNLQRSYHSVGSFLVCILSWKRLVLFYGEPLLLFILFRKVSRLWK